MSAKRPNILYLVHRFPYPPNRGDRIRSFHLLEHFTKHYNVYLGTLWDEPPKQSELLLLNQMCKEFAGFPIGRYTRWLRAARSLANGESATVGLFEAPELFDLVDEWVNTIDFDLALVYCSSMVNLLDNAPHLPLIVDLVDVDSQKWFDYADRSRGIQKWLFRLEGRRLRTLERSLPERCRAITLVSESEAELFRDICPNSQPHCVGNGVELNYFQPQEISTGPSVSCVFVGALDYRANIQGLKWFVEQCWPSIRRLNPQATLEVVGRNPVAAVRRLAAHPGVHVVGQVPDVRPFVHNAAISIAPLLTARGIQNKLLEAMAMGAAVVASPPAIQGIECCVGEHVLQADTPREWTEIITELLADRSRRAVLGKAARAFVVQHYSWPARLKALANLMKPFSSLTTQSGDPEPVSPATVSGSLGRLAGD